MAMAASARQPNPSFSSFSSCSLASSSASLPAPSLLDLAEDLWFYRSVLPLPPLALPCLPPVFFPSPVLSSPALDTSTLLAQCMRDRACLSPSLLAFKPSSPPADLDLTSCGFCYPPSPAEDEDRSSPLSESQYDDGWYHSRPALVDEEEAFHYYSASSDWDDEHVFKGYSPLSDMEDESELYSEKEEQVQSDPEDVEDALSGIYDVAALLKHQRYREIEGERESCAKLTHSRPPHKAVKQVTAFPQIQVLSTTDQADMKENLKLWAHAVALTLPWQAAAKARPLL